ncbi:MAG: hypothetical protein K2K55_09720 [Duncaniella sp.]|nr:hypothetical protein [Duncaniella sp.]
MPRYLYIIFSIMLAIYLALAFVVTAGESDSELCRAMTISIEGADEARQFVSAEELSHELDDLPTRAKGLSMANINTHQLRQKLLAMDKIEDVSVLRYTDGSIHIYAQPIVPVARVFDGKESYYINRIGKRVKASSRYRRNVPVITGSFPASDTTLRVTDLLPLIDRIYSDSLWAGYISMIEVKSPNDIILVPAIREHVINIGSIGNLDDKLDRVLTFYTNVLPHQGWNKYDTISVKWKGQIVATKRHRAVSRMSAAQYDDDESIAISSMLAGDSVAPGRILPGQKAHSERPIPKKQI